MVVGVQLDRNRAEQAQSKEVRTALLKQTRVEQACSLMMIDSWKCNCTKHFLCSIIVGEKQAATHVSLDQEFEQSSTAMWCRLEEQLVSSANRGIVPPNFQPTQSCLNSQTDNLRPPLAVMEGEKSWVKQWKWTFLLLNC